MKRTALTRRAGSTGTGVKTRARVILWDQTFENKEELPSEPPDRLGVSECAAQSRVKAA